MNRGFLFSIILLAAAAPAHAEVIITEIMYDLEGSDTGREWIEIKNTGNSQIDITGWKLFEANTNHGITAADSQTLVLAGGAYAVIADSPEKFLVDWPDFTGILFDSLFSLSNTGEALTLRNSELADVDSVAYSSSAGAAGDGNSLQKKNGEWIGALPTPGEGIQNSTISPSLPSEAVSDPGGGGLVKMAESSSKLKAYAGEDRTVLAGAEVGLEGSAEGLGDATVGNARFLWNFGDGKTGEGKNISHAFSFPGTYTVTLTISLAGESASDFMQITAVENPVVISEIKPAGYAEIYNASPRKLDFSGFGIVIGGTMPFHFPANTFLAPWAYLALEQSALRFEIPSSGEIKILYPNGKVVFSSVYPAMTLGDKDSLSLTDSGWVRSKQTPGAQNEVVKTKIAPSSPPSVFPARPARLPDGQAGGPESAAAEKETAEINIASVSSPTSSVSRLINSEYIWLIAGLAVGILAGSIFLFAK